MLGAYPPIEKKRWGFRNFFGTTKGSSDFVKLCELAKYGLIELYKTNRDLVYFRATKKGCEYIGLSKRAMKRAGIKE